MIKGNRIDYWMEEQGLKNKHVAKACEVSEQTFSKWRQNKTQPSLIQSGIIAKKLNVSVDDLIEWEES
ncbi:helix-turn-helix transcriptional regulator [Cytobacillus purgationiresistens]|uniref:Transcriptional regulator with XRE-family HTH domain n=1 Tax=Cytobacillus purgationiresistens TaxID=863449 RepID=A0ABU0AC73_9BACI|nr:helix-turn-helix transcriptional regulator [Cytobacillus purgationiresistens]MDQ0268853.1 transcriptional regulator with XRE-family HTH domain [Cytobacillus purgationiresistens]